MFKSFANAEDFFLNTLDNIFIKESNGCYSGIWSVILEYVGGRGEYNMDVYEEGSSGDEVGGI